MKAPIVAIACALLASCAMPDTEKEMLVARYEDIPVYRTSFECFGVDYVAFAIRSRVKYEAHRDPQCPEKTWKSGKGDCEDQALLYLNILYVNYGIKGSLCLSRIDVGRYHAFIRMPSGVMIEPQTGDYVYEEPYVVLTFDQVFEEEI